MESDFKHLAESLLKMLESERARVAGVVGDEVASLVTMARYLIEDAAHQRPRGELAEISGALLEASARIRDATRDLRTLCSELRPRVLDDLGLLPALSSHLRDFGRENRAFLVWPRITVAETEIPGDLKLAIFRIVQAALSNVARHSKASTVRMFLSTSGHELRLGIEDNGVGFDPERLHHRRCVHDGCGLRMIQLWAEISGGRCNIESSARHGARVLASWQMHEASGARPAPQDSEMGVPPTPAPA